MNDSQHKRVKTSGDGRGGCAHALRGLCLWSVLVLCVLGGGLYATISMPELGPQLQEESPLDYAFELDYSATEYPRYVVQGDQLVEGKNSALHLSFERIFSDQWGKWGMGLTAGYYSNRGIVVTGTQDTVDVVIFPVGLFLTYRFDYMKDQLFVPYAKVGAAVSFVKQSSNSGYGQPEKKAYSWDYAVGLSLCLNRMEPSYATRIDHSIGLNNTYFSVEMVQGTALATSAPNTSFTAYRFGLRFEL